MKKHTLEKENKLLKPLLLWKRLKSYLLPYKKSLWFLGISIVLTALSVLSIGQCFSFLINKALVTGTSYHLTISLIILMGLVFILSLGSFSRVYISTTLGERVSLDIREKVLNHILYLNSPFYDKHPTGELTSQLSHDLTILQTLLSTSAPIAFRNALLALGSIIMMIYTNWQLSLLVAFLIPVIASILLFFGRKNRLLSKNIQESYSKSHALVIDLLGNVKLSQAYNHQPYDIKLYKRALLHVFQKTKKYALHRAILVSTIMSVFFFCSAILLWIGSSQVLVNNLPVGNLTSFIFYTLLVASASGSLGEIFSDTQKGLAALYRIEKLMRYTLSPKIINIPSSLKENLVSLKFSNVNFSYPTRPNVQVLKNFTLDLSLPKKIAIVGPSGSGKSTILSLLLGFYPTCSGSIYVNGTSLNKIPLDYWRNQIAWVPQETSFHNTTIEELLKFGNPDATHKEIWEALSKSQLDLFIKQLPNGLKTQTGTLGMNLSAGQRQRLNLARALLKKCPILLLDEATNSLDAKNQKLIQKTLDHFERRTIIMIAHHFSTIEFVDEIVVVDQGKILNSGTHSFLMTKCTLYKELYLQKN